MFINFESLPEFLTVKDLVALGLYPTQDAAYLARLRGKSPDYVQIGGKILFPKKCVSEFLEKRLVRGDIPKEKEAGKKHEDT